MFSLGGCMICLSLRTLLLVIAVRFLDVSAPAVADDRSAAAILKDIEANPIPTWNPRTADQSTIRKAIADRAIVLPLRAKLIGELFRADPSSPRLESLL